MARMRHRSPNSIRRRKVSATLLCWCLLVPVASLLTGCRPNKRYDTIEAELRTKDRELAEVRAALDRAQSVNRAYEQSQQNVAPIPGAPIPATTVGACGIREIVLARGTGGVDEDGLPGDESLMIVIVPRDEDRSEVKVVGRVQIAAWEISPQGTKTPIGAWDISAERLRPTWRNSVISTGYFVALPWQTYPSTDKVRIAVRFTTTDGTAFETDRDITVRPVPQAYPRRPAVGQPLEPSAPPGVEELPPPAGLQPGRGASLRPPEKP